MDQISSLPTSILHDILSRLPRKDAGRTIILSKAWKDIWSTFPFLVFDENDYDELREIRRNLIDFVSNPIVLMRTLTDQDFNGKRDNFVNNIDSTLQRFRDRVDSTLLRFRDQGSVLKEFKLVIGFCALYYGCDCKDLWIELASEIGVEVLELELDELYGWECEPYYLPSRVLEAKSLKKLTLSGSFIVGHAFLNHPTNFSSLQVLSLSFVKFEDEQVFQNLISRCPLIEYIILKWCLGLESVTVSIHGLPRLKRVEVEQFKTVIVIDAPSLENFHYSGDGFFEYPLPNIEMCRNLRGLRLMNLIKRTVITDQWLCELFYQCPLLESLELEHCTTFQRIRISSHQLKVLKLMWCFELEKVDIDAPNLCFCECDFYFRRGPIIYILNSSNKLEVNFHVSINSYMNLKELRKFLQNFKSRQALVSLNLSINQLKDELNTVFLQDISVPPPSIKHLQLKQSALLRLQLQTVYSSLHRALLWCCCPAIISMKLDYNSDKILIELLCKELMCRLKGNDCCCSSRNIKCSFEYCSSQIKFGLKDVKVTSSSRMHGNLVDCKTFLDTLATLPAKEEVIFRLEW